jgi:anti-sigma factor RsiW
MRWELMDRYLAGECDPTELREVERWLAEAPSRRRFLEQLAGPGEAELGEAKARIWARLEDEVAPVSPSPEPLKSRD